MGEVILFPKKYDPELTYSELAKELQVSTRWLRYRHKEGMPSVGVGYDGKRRFRLSEVREYLRNRETA